MILSFNVLQNENNMILRDFLRSRGVSASLIRSIKTHGGFFCNNMPIHTNISIKCGDIIAFNLPSNEQTTVIPQDIPIEVVYEDEHAIVLNKPAGQAVHPTLNYKDNTLANAFCAYMQKKGIKKIFRPINRLDKNTSGLVLCALNEYSCKLLANSAKKTYYAIVQGKTPKAGEINLPISLQEGSFIKRTTQNGTQKSTTIYKTICQNDNFSLLELQLLTGRTHQIRVHLSSIGYPLAGDDLYGGSMQFINRHALHCAKISFLNIKKAYGANISDNFNDISQYNNTILINELITVNTNFQTDMSNLFININAKININSYLNK